MRVIGPGRRYDLSLPALLILSFLFLIPILPGALAGGKERSPAGKGGGKESSCFCKIDSGVLDDCPCTTSAIDEFNSKTVHKKVTKLVEQNFFRYFQVNFNKPCKFWPDGDGQCGSRNCAVDTCSESEVPEQILNHKDEHKKKDETISSSSHSLVSYLEEKLKEFLPILEPLVVSFKQFAGDYLPASGGEACSGDPLPSYSRVDTHLPAESAELLDSWCTLDPLESGEGCDYIDLLRNPEQFTGYKGTSANRIWSKIYSELCFSPEKEGDLCLEQKTLNRIVSGLHSSITIHVTRNYLLQEENIFKGMPAVWGPNYMEFKRRFDPSLTGGLGPEWLRNVYYLYLVQLRAIAKAGQVLNSVHYTDPETAKQVASLVTALQVFKSSLEEEEEMFNPKDLSKLEMLAQVRSKFRDISHLMDCMGCERCKVWGKLQVTGIGTALKVLVTPVSELRLSRHEVVALINGFARVSTSIMELETFRT
jgi:ERO1-like protein alpha